MVLMLMATFPLVATAQKDNIPRIPASLDGGNAVIKIPDNSTFNETVGTGFDFSIDFIANRTSDGVSSLMRFTERAEPQTISVADALLQFHVLHLQSSTRRYIEDTPDGSTGPLVGRKETGIMRYKSISRTNNYDIHYGEVFIVSACDRLYTFEIFTRDGHSLKDSKIQGYYLEGILGSVQFDESC